MNLKIMKTNRETSQPLLPVKAKDIINNQMAYTAFPYHPLSEGKIFEGYESLATWIIEQKTVLIDGFSGVFWDTIEVNLNEEIKKKGFTPNFIDTRDFLKPENTILILTADFMGEKNAVWGKKTTLSITNFFRVDELKNVIPNPSSEINIVFGVGASLTNLNAPLLYLDVPKNEIQYRMRAEAISNLGIKVAKAPFEMYKRFFFVDWEVLNNHKREIFNQIDAVADTQWTTTLTWMNAKDWKAGLNKLSSSAFRVRPWFEKGAWGGQWMKEKLGLNPNEINYAWSFELITPENGIIFENNGNLLEVPFDSLMIANEEALLGKHAKKFGLDFPIRFDFLDTFKGGNLSIQCHPSLKYIQENFGETITQDETYYILDCDDHALVYLGFQEDINPTDFKDALISSQKLNQQIDIPKYVQAFEAKKHDLFLIPNGTVHSAGANNLVLEISATPYIFTFKMYDWVRLDLSGNPRPINIEHAFNNLNFNRKGKKIVEELISKPKTIAEDTGWKVIHLPTHKDHFYDVHRLDFDQKITVETNNICHVMMLVEGTAVGVITELGEKLIYQYAETFVIPAKVKSYTLINIGANKAKVIKAFLK